MNWQQTIYLASDLAESGLGWEDIKLKLAKAGAPRIPDNELRRFVMGHQRPQAKKIAP